MKKALLSLIAAAIAIISMSAQDTVTENPGKKPFLGFRLSAELTCPGKVSDDKTSIGMFKCGGGIDFGAIYNIPIVSNFYVEPGFGFYYNVYSVKDKYLSIVKKSLLAYGYGYYGADVKSMSIRKFGLRIPVMAGYHFDFPNNTKLSLFTGPELEAGILAQEYIRGKGTKINHTLYDAAGELNRIDILWGIGAGITYRQYYLGVKGSIGLLNMFSYAEGSFHENRVALTLGYNF